MISFELILCCPLLLLPSVFPSISVFPMSSLFASGGQSIGYKNYCVTQRTNNLPKDSLALQPVGRSLKISSSCPLNKLPLPEEPSGCPACDRVSENRFCAVRNHQGKI